MSDRTEQGPERELQINQWLKNLHGASDKALATTMELGARLAPVLRDPDPTPCGEEAGYEDLVPVARDLRMAIGVMENITRRNQEVLELLEL